MSRTYGSEHTQVRMCVRVHSPNYIRILIQGWAKIRSNGRTQVTENCVMEGKGRVGSYI